MTSMIHENNAVSEAVHGYQVVLECNGLRDVIIVRLNGIENDTDAICKALTAARNGYPTGIIRWVEVHGPSRYIPTGLPADEAGDCIWAT